MATPGRGVAYANQVTLNVGDPIVFVLDDGNWTENPTSFEVNTLPPGFTTDGQNLGGTADAQMLYIIFVRGVNDEGPGDWFPLQWIVVGGEQRQLYGLPVDWPSLPQLGLGTVAVLFINRATAGGPQHASGSGVLLVNDIPDVDGTSARYGPGALYSQLLLNGVADTFLRATVPGWEVIIDKNG